VPARIIRTTDKPDKITVFYGNSSFFAAEQPFKASTNTSKKAESRHGFKINDAVIVANSPTAATSCALIEISGDTNADGLTLDHAANSLRYNGAGTAGYSTGVLFNLGPRPQLNTWAVRNNELLNSIRVTALTVTDELNLNTTAAVADGIIDLQARYGIDNGPANNPTYKVGKWLTVAEGDPANWTRLLAVRVAILARSQQYEPTKPGPTYVTSVPPNWLDGEGNSVDFVMTNVNGSADSNPKDDNDWRNYRYRVYSATIPLRNMVWGVSP
jgi:type IV pilus assembly protein PilW